MKNGAIFHPLRVAVSGRTEGPSLWHMVEFLGERTNPREWNGSRGSKRAGSIPRAQLKVISGRRRGLTPPMEDRMSDEKFEMSGEADYRFPVARDVPGDGRTGRSWAKWLIR